MHKDSPSEWEIFWKRWPYSQNFVHGSFTHLKDKMAMVKRWEGVNPDDVDNAVAYAASTGVISMYEMEARRNPYLDLVITVYRESVEKTFGYATSHLSKYLPGLIDVRQIAGTRPFTPNSIAVEAIDLGSIRVSGDESIARAREQKLERLAGFGVIYSAIQNPKWVERTRYGEKRLPRAVAASLLVNLTNHDPWIKSPMIACRHFGPEVSSVDTQQVGLLSEIAIPVLL